MNDIGDIPPKPSPSPHPRTERSRDPRLDEPKTDPYLRVKLDEMAHATEEQLRKHDNKLTLRSLMVAVGAVATGVVAVIVFIDNRVQAQTDAGNRATSAELKAQDARLTTLEKRFDRFEERNDKQMNLLLDANGVPKSKRPPPLVKDGGVVLEP